MRCRIKGWNALLQNVDEVCCNREKFDLQERQNVLANAYFDLI